MTHQILNKRPLLLVALSLCLLGVSASAAIAQAQCPTESVVSIDLKTGLVIGSSPQVSFSPIVTPTSGTYAGWGRTVAKIDLGRGCKCASIVAEYEGLPFGWTLNIGDSPTNNGYGGDSGNPDSEAEMQIVNQDMSVYSSALGPGIVDNLMTQHFGLNNAALKFVVCNQYLSFGNPNGVLQTPNSKLLYALPDAGAGNNSLLYVGLNRVVAGPGARVGKGLRRATISFQ
jgi:hypothetical protein